MEPFGIAFIVKLVNRIELFPRGIYCSGLCIALAFRSEDLLEDISVVLVLRVRSLLLGTLNFQGKSGRLNNEFVICHVGFIENKEMRIENNGPHFPSMIEHILNNKMTVNFSW